MIRHWWQSTFLLFALFALVACSGSAPEAESTLVEVPPTTPIPPTSSPWPSATIFPTETATLTPSSQQSLTATPEPTSTPSPTDTPAPTETPTPEVVVAEGEVLFQMTLGTETISAAVPEFAAPILSAGGTERGQVDEVDKAIWRVSENEITLGKVPVFLRNGNEWRFNEAVKYEENYINLGPALVLPDVSSFENPELTEWPPAGLLISNHAGFDTMSVSGQLASGQISDVVLFYQGQAIETQRALLQYKFKNPNTGGITTFGMFEHDSIWIENVRQPLSRLSSVQGAQAGSLLTSRKSYPFNIQIVGSELGDVNINDVRTMILAGGLLNNSDDYYLGLGFAKY